MNLLLDTEGELMTKCKVRVGGREAFQYMTVQITRNFLTIKPRTVVDDQQINICDESLLYWKADVYLV